MYKKYCCLCLSILIVFFIIRVYLHSEHIKSAYYTQHLTTKKQAYFKKKQLLHSELLALQSADLIKKNVSTKLNFIPLQLKQIHSLAQLKASYE